MTPEDLSDLSKDELTALRAEANEEEQAVIDGVLGSKKPDETDVTTEKTTEKMSDDSDDESSGSVETKDDETDNRSEEDSDDSAAKDTDSEDEVVDNSPFGQSFAKQVHSGLSGVQATLETGMKALEQPSMIETAGVLSESLKDMMVALDGGYSEAYPDAPSLSKMIEDEMSDDEDDSVKTLASSHPFQRMRVGGISKSLQSISVLDGIPIDVRLELTSAYKHLDRIRESAKTYKSDTDDQLQQMQEMVDAVPALCDASVALAERIDSFVPQNKSTKL